jgi:GTP-binding protein Era
MDLNGQSHLPDDLSPNHRSGFVAVMGRPNVGKSTLINRLLGQKVAIVSPKPQTTRNRLLGILTLDAAQVIFVDTPGIHTPKHRLGEAMVDAAAAALVDADAVLWVVDVSTDPTDEDRQVATRLAEMAPVVPVVLGLNKVDRAAPERLAECAREYAALAPRANWQPVSATRGDNLGRLLDLIVASLPLGPRFYPEDQITDQQERFVAAELVREQVLMNLRDEVPHSVAVAVNEFKVRSEEMTYISAVIFVERESQKGIVLGKEGQMLKCIGQGARQGIEEMLDTRVYLDLWVKVRPKWRDRDDELRRLGYQPPIAATRKGGEHHSKAKVR